MKMYGEDKQIKKKKKKKSPRGLVVTFLLFLIVGCICGALWLSNVKPPDISQGDGEEKENSDLVDVDTIKINDYKRKDDFFNILIIGTDLNGVHTDSIMIASFDVANKKLNVLSVPRDTIVNVKRANKKINAAYSISGEPGDVSNLYDELESILGFKPDKHIIVSTQGFVDMIDAIGGVEVDVQRNMKYSDPTQDLYIDIDKGLQVLDGYDSMCFMRYRYGYIEGDIGRVRAQQQFIGALMKKMILPSTLVKLPELCEIVMDNVKTDLTIGNMIWLGTAALEMNLDEDLKTYIIPGEGQYYKKLSYFFPYKNQTTAMINEVFNPYVEPIEELNILDYEELTGEPLMGD